MGEGSMHIGEVAEQVGLSVRSIRYYEEVGLITASARTAGGFRLYTAADAHRLQVIKDMKPLGFSLDEMRDLFAVFDCLDDPRTTDTAYDQATEKLAIYRLTAENRYETLRIGLHVAESFAGQLRRSLAEHRSDGS